ncbi:MAG: adaptor protein MecA [Clostridia bacterium]|nr:adaptor protein MecA [Clostridia bacterium]
MEWIRISTNKLKIMLSAEDARRYALNCETADYADVVTREAFREILTDVRKETGFDATDDKVYIQMYPSKEGGCELFVTKMGLLLTEEKDKNENHTSKLLNIEAKNEKSHRTVRKRSASFLFPSFEHLVALCRRMTDTYRGESEIWRDEQGIWWLILTENGNPLTIRDDYRFIREYGRMVSAEEARIILPEHGVRICDRCAIDIFARF